MKKKRKKKRNYWRAPYRTGTIQLRVNKKTYDVLVRQAKGAGVYLPAYVRYLLEHRLLDMRRPGINSDEWVWDKLISNYYEQAA